jgi:hypothetical protein
MRIVHMPEQAQIHPVRPLLPWVYCANLGPCPTNPDSQRVAQAFGYTPEELQSVPAEAHMGLSCGNPVAAATLREVGEHQFQVFAK